MHLLSRHCGKTSSALFSWFSKTRRDVFQEDTDLSILFWFSAGKRPVGAFFVIFSKTRIQPPKRFPRLFPARHRCLSKRFRFSTRRRPLEFCPPRFSARHYHAFGREAFFAIFSKTHNRRNFFRAFSQQDTEACRNVFDFSARHRPVEFCPSPFFSKTQTCRITFFQQDTTCLSKPFSRFSAKQATAEIFPRLFSEKHRGLSKRFLFFSKTQTCQISVVRPLFQQDTCRILCDPLFSKTQTCRSTFSQQDTTCL